MTVKNILVVFLSVACILLLGACSRDHSASLNDANLQTLPVIFSDTEATSLLIGVEDFPDGWTVNQSGMELSAKFVESMTVKKIDITIDVHETEAAATAEVLNKKSEALNIIAERGISGDELEDIEEHQMFVWMRSGNVSYRTEKWMVVGAYGNVTLMLFHEGSINDAEKSFAVRIAKTQMEKIQATTPTSIAFKPFANITISPSLIPVVRDQNVDQTDVISGNPRVPATSTPTLTPTAPQGTTSGAAALIEESQGLSSGLMAHWRLDEGGGSSAIDEGKLNVAILTNGPIWGGGKMGGAILFDGEDDYMMVPDHSSIQPSGQITVATWLRVDSTGSDYMDLIRKESAYEVYISKGGTIYWSPDGNAGLSSDVNIVTGRWYHVVGTHDGNPANNTRIYVDGELRATATLPLPVRDSSIGKWSRQGWTSDLKIGGTPSHHFDGALDDIRIYDRALTHGEVKDLHMALEIHWPLDERRGAIAVDQIQGNTATLTNGPIWADSAIESGIIFDGIDDYLEVPYDSSLNPPGQITVSLWFKMRANGSDYVDLMRHGNGYDLFITGSEFIRWTTDGSAGLSSGVVAEYGEWYHIVGTHNGMLGDNTRIYVNGRLKATGTFPLKFGGTASLKIGGTDRHYFDGLIDDVRIYGRALNADEVLETFNVSPRS